MVPSYEPVASRLGGQKAMQRMSSWWPLSRRGTSNARPAAVVLLPGCLDTLSGSGCSTSSRDQPTDAKYWKAPWLMCSTPVSSRVASSSLSAARAAAVALAAAAKAAEVAEAVWAALSAARRAGGVAISAASSAEESISFISSPLEKFHRRTTPSAAPVSSLRPELSKRIAVSLAWRCSKRKRGAPVLTSHTQMRPASSPETTRKNCEE
mmetsp:Transcript_71046/g.171575  ORF Transcript_71046/g.171575 Transcript_71046/m.171575 type:complete len:209 (+) Transcript_71046:222-848(+)